MLYEDASGREKIHSLQPQTHGGLHCDWFVNVMGLLFLPCLVPGIIGVHSKGEDVEQEKEAALKLMGSVWLEKTLLPSGSPTGMRDKDVKPLPVSGCCFFAGFYHLTFRVGTIFRYQE